VKVQSLPESTVYTEIVDRFVSVGFCPLNPPNLGDFEIESLSSKSPRGGDLGGRSRLKRSQKDLYVRAKNLIEFTSTTLFTAMKRHVHTVRLRSHDEALIHRGAVLLEDALHTASFPESGRLLLVRSLNVGKIHSQQSSATLALVIEQRFAQIGMMAVHAKDPTADSAIAVYFRDQIEPYLCLAVRLANHLSADEWFWRLAVVNWQPNLSREEGLRRVLYGVAQTAIGVSAIVSLMQELFIQNAITPMLSSLTWQDGAALLRACGWIKSDSSIELKNPLSIAFLSKPWINLLQDWIEAWGIEDSRSLWFTAIVLIVGQPGFILDEQLIVRSRQIIQQISNSEKLFQSDQSIILERSIAISEDSRSVLNESLSSTNTSQRQDSYSYLESPQFSAFSGLFFLLPLMIHLKIESFLESNPALIKFNLPRRLLNTIAQRLKIPKDDPVRAALIEHSNDGSDSDLLRSWLTSMRRWCRLNAEMGLHNLVARSGQVSITPTHIDVWFEPQQADIRIRRVGLDLDPGWVPWFGRVVAFHYTGAGYGN